MNSNPSSPPPRSVGTRLVLGVALALPLVLAGCNFAIGAIAVGVAATVAFVGYGCGEPVDVTVWDRKTAHPVCDATVTAEQNGSSYEFSPCYRLHLGDGAWVVKASKPGYVTAVGSVTVNKERRCSEPTFHSVALTLMPEGDAPPAPVQVQPEPTQVPPAPAAPAPAAPAPAAPASAAPASAAPPPSASFPAVPAPASS